jgi:hypothetical protein
MPLGHRGLEQVWKPPCAMLAAFLGHSVTSSSADGDQSKRAACRPNV